MKETKAEIRNKLQMAITVLESLSKDKRVPKNLLITGKKDLEKILGLLDKL